MWNANELKKLITRKLKGYLFVICSNREPYAHQYGPKKQIICRKSIGGLTIALDPVLQTCGGTWVAWGSGDADREVVDEHNRVHVPPGNPTYTLRRIWMSKEEENGFYYGYANQALWPLSHIVYRQPIFLISDWEYYKLINRRYAEAVLEECGSKKSFVWLHDYQLTLVAKYIKEAKPKSKVALFWHIPWPNPEAFRICPQKREILEGLLSNDLLGFHVRYHCHNFIRTVEQELEARTNLVELSVTYKGHKTLIRPFPISIDAEKIRQHASSDAVTRLVNDGPIEIEPSYEYLALSVDRIDYTKGILEKIHAVDRFLEKYPEYQGKFVFLQIGALSRMHIKAYKQLIDDIQALVEEVNWKYRTDRWYPIVLINRKLDYDTHLATYRMANLFLVGSLHDGMNLTAKEYIMSNVDHKGMLILSKFTGAARELGDSLQVNPYNADEFADAIKAGLEMSQEEKEHRLKHMEQEITEHNIYTWAGKFIETLTNL